MSSGSATSRSPGFAGPDADQSTSGSGIGLPVGAAVGGVLVIVCIAALVVFLVRRGNKKEPEDIEYASPGAVSYSRVKPESFNVKGKALFGLGTRLSPPLLLPPIPHIFFCVYECEHVYVCRMTPVSQNKLALFQVSGLSCLTSSAHLARLTVS